MRASRAAAISGRKHRAGPSHLFRCGVTRLRADDGARDDLLVRQGLRRAAAEARRVVTEAHKGLLLLPPSLPSLPPSDRAEEE